MANILNTVQNLVDDDLKKLEVSGLEKTNPEKYFDFKKRLSGLKQSMINDQNSDVNASFYEIQYAKISAELEMFMIYENGQKSAQNLQNEQINSTLASFIDRLTRYNYEQIRVEFNNYLALCPERCYSDLSIQGQITFFNYQVYKFKIEDLLWDDTVDISSFINLVIQDIKAILADNLVSENIKDLLKSYLLDESLLRKNFNEVIKLINIGFTLKNASSQMLDQELKQDLYKESDLEKEFYPLSVELKNRFTSFVYSNVVEIIARKNAILNRCGIDMGRAKAYLENLYKYAQNPGELRAFAFLLCYSEEYPFLSYGTKNNGYYIPVIVDTFLQNGFTDFRYLFESILQSSKTSDESRVVIMPQEKAKILVEPKKMLILSKLAEQLKKAGYDCSYEQECAVISQRDNLSPEELQWYIRKTDNEALKRYFYKNRVDSLKQTNEEVVPSLDYTSVYHLVGSPDVKDFVSLISDLQNMDSTKEVLMTIFNYFKLRVLYDYDELQVVKFLRKDSKKLQDISDYLYQNKDLDSLMFKEMLIRLLDEAFMELEGRGLSEKNKVEWFKNYGKTIHHEARPAKDGLFKVPAIEAYDEIVHIDAKNYPPVYENGLLIKGVCSAYVDWVQKICNMLGISCLIVRGRGTTSHVWNLIYVKETNSWVNFDMTMAKFYLDGWNRECGEAEKWVMASCEEMFKMQPSRTVEEIISQEGEVIFKDKIDASNVQELESFLASYEPGSVPKK